MARPTFIERGREEERSSGEGRRNDRLLNAINGAVVHVRRQWGGGNGGEREKRTLVDAP
jgi:hypothetical protein